MKVYLYENTKRFKSTKAAPVTYTELDCTLKENCSLIEPVLKIYAASQPTANYMSFEGRYYWITNIVSLANNLWELHGMVDPLTTFRGHIFNTTAFVLYDSTPNTQLPDSRLGIETDCDTYTATASMPWYYTTGTDGTYFIATVGEEDTIQIGFDTSDDLKFTGHLVEEFRNPTGVYAIPQSSLAKVGFDFDDFLRELLAINADMVQAIRTTLNAMDISQIPSIPVTDFQALVQWLMTIYKDTLNVTAELSINYPTRLALLLAQNLIGGGNALQNVKASYWLPFTIPGDALETPDTNKLALGTYTDTVPGLRRVVEPIITSLGNISVNIPWHFNDWRDVSCTEIMLYIPLIGCINIPPEVVKGNDTIELKFALNLYSGELAVEVSCNGAQLGTYGTNCAMNILIGDSNVNMGGAVNTVVGAVTKNYASVAGGVTETLSGMSTSVGGIGGGAGTGLTNQIVCTCRCHETSQNPSALLGTIGTPTRQLKTLSTSLGYCQTMNAQVNGAAVSGEPHPTQTELNMINEYLDTGVYLE